MKSKKTKGKGHGHPWIMGILGLLVATMIFIHLPKLKVLSGAVLLFALVHLILAGVVLISGYMISPQKLKYKLFEKRKLKKMEGKYYFGWSYGWMNMFWLAGLVVLMIAVWVYFYNPHLVWVSLILFLASLNLFAGNFVLRTSKKNSFMTLPMVDLTEKQDAIILDAGCGSGRTTLELVKHMKTIKVIAFDRFDSDYIENGGKTLLERNLKIAGVENRVEILQGDITDIPVEEGKLDAAVSSYMMDHLGKYKLDALKEIQRILKPGGRFLLIVFVPGWTTFSVFNVACLSLTSVKGWKKMFAEAKLELKSEGVMNSGVYFLLEK
jgi:ubiquinone/menaquinone biosynthesis C-methylase UbiE